MKITKLRMIDWAALAVALFVVVAIVAPQNVAVVVYKLALVALGGVLGYWLDRSLFPYARPDAFEPGIADGPEAWLRYLSLAFAAAMVRRALIVAAAMVGVTLGL